MKTQQLAEREEQQRIKNLVLNYDLRESEEQESEADSTPLLPNCNVHKQNRAGSDKPSYHHNRSDRPAKEKPGQRVRKLQMSDVVDWYGKPQTPPETPGKKDGGARESSTGGNSRSTTPSERSKAREPRLCRQDTNKRR